MGEHVEKNWIVKADGDFSLFESFDEAEKYARRHVRDFGGITRITKRGVPDLYAVVSRDALDRIWTDRMMFDA